MSNIASVVNGEVQQANAANAQKKNGSSLDKDAFLQLLVTQMKYQDPLEPQDNSEYVAQLATFSELEEMQNMTASSDISRATSLVGQYVTVNVTNESGNTTVMGGKVDYVVVENNKAYLNINGANYSIDDLDSVVDEKYLTAYDLSLEWNASLATLPNVPNLTTAYKDVLDNLRGVYNDMTDYQKSFISKDSLTTLEAYEERMKELMTVDGTSEGKLDTKADSEGDSKSDESKDNTTE